MSSTTTTRRQAPHRTARLALTTAAALAVALCPAQPAYAHHGWDGFDTDRLLYVSGEVTSDGRWGEPHSVFDVTLDDAMPPDTPDLQVPDELRGPEDSVRVQAAVSYSGSRSSLEVIIAPPAWSGRWGLDRALTVQERFQAVGYVNRNDDGLFRPVAFWYGDDQVPVNQVLGETLPVRAPLPGSASSSTSGPSSRVTSTAPDPLDLPAPEAERSSAPAASGGQETGTLGVWAVFGAAVAAVAGSGTLYLRRRARGG